MDHLTGKGCYKHWDCINQNNIHTALHQAKKVMIKALHLNYLVDQEDNNLACLRFIISNSSINNASMLWPHFGIASIDTHWSALWSYNTKHLSFTLHVSTCESKSTLVSTTVILLWALNCSAHTLGPDTAFLSTHFMLMFHFLMILRFSWNPCSCHPVPGKLLQDFLCFSPTLDLWDFLTLYLWHLPPLVKC